MREIELKKVKINLMPLTGEDQEIEFSYKQSMLDALNAIVEKGITIEDVEKRIKIRKLINEAIDKVQLNEDDYEYLKRLVLEEKWKLSDQSIVDYVNHIKNARQVI